MCEKDIAYNRDGKYFDKLVHISVEARTVVVGWLMEVCEFLAPIACEFCLSIAGLRRAQSASRNAAFWPSTFSIATFHILQPRLQARNYRRRSCN